MKKIFFKDSFNLIYSKLRLEKGLMLSEVLIVVAIILILTSVVMVSHREGQKGVTLERAAHKLAQDIRVAEEMALSGRECPECGLPGAKGYGIYFEENLDEYIIYADKNGDEAYNDPLTDPTIETIPFEKGLFIKSINTASGKVSINFLPPDPKIRIKWGGIESDSTMIEIALKNDQAKTRTVTVNTVGLIEID